MAPHYTNPKGFTKEGFDKDEYETPTYVLDMILEELDSEVCEIWEPFPGSGWSTTYMESKGFTVTNGVHKDFFKHACIPKTKCPLKTMFVITNPPYSKKKQVIQKFKALGVKSIGLFIPIATLSTLYFYHDFPKDSFQLILHRKHCKYLHPRTHEPLGDAPFDCAWVTNALNLSQNIMYKEK